MGMRIPIVLLTLACFATSVEAMAQPKPSDQKRGAFAVPTEQHVKAELVTEHASIQPNGSTRVGVLFELENGWHIYAKDPGDAGLPTTVVWKAPSAVSFGPLAWPPAKQFLDPGDIKTFGYSSSVLLSGRITYEPLLNPNNAYEDLPIRAHVEWLACKEICVPGFADLQLMLPVSTNPPARSALATLFEPVHD